MVEVESVFAVFVSAGFSESPASAAVASGVVPASVLISLLKVTASESSEYHQSLDPFGRARFAVSWAGEAESRNWFDTAREYTERWHHQQQIRLAVDRPGIMTRPLDYPVLDTFMRALPYHYRDVERAAGVTLRVRVSGDCGGDWHLCRASAA